jgi:DNA-binding NarL/FixJ family response regulator
VRLWSTFVLAVNEVEDQDELRAFFSRGLRPLVTANGRTLLRCLAECHGRRGGADPLIDLAVADVDVRGISGIEILKVVQELQWPVHVVLTSSTRDPELRRRAIDLGAAAYLDRPVSQAHLRHLFRRLVAGY